MGFEREREQLQVTQVRPLSNHTGLCKQRFFPQRLEGPTRRDWQRGAQQRKRRSDLSKARI